MTKNVFLYAPNLVDYGRAVCILIACYTAFQYPICTVVLYVLNQVLDAFDGWIARKLG
jgi:CDP-diacylglycerol--inositol 3-phosphatidyltransferase